MKTIFIILLSIFVMAGCAGLQFNEGIDTQTTAILAGAAAREIACEVVKSGQPELKRSIENIYLSVKDGTLTPDAIAQLAELTKSRPTLAASITDLVELVGVRIDVPTAGAVNVVEIPPEVFERVERGWVQGIQLCGGAGS